MSTGVPLATGAKLLESQDLRNEKTSEDVLATTSGQLLVTLGSVENIPVSDVNAFAGMYCIVAFDKQQVLSDSSIANASTTEDGTNVISSSWNENFMFDVTQSLATAYLSISLWGRTNEGSSCIGTTRVTLTNFALDSSVTMKVPLKVNKERRIISTFTPPQSATKSAVNTTTGTLIGRSPMRSPGIFQTSKDGGSSNILHSGPGSGKLSGNHPSYQTPKKTNSNSLNTNSNANHTSSVGSNVAPSPSTPSSSNATSPSSSIGDLTSLVGGLLVTGACLTLTILIRQDKRKVNENDFEKLRVIGRGTFGKVFQARKKDTGRIYAMKVLKKDHVVKNNAVKHTMSENHVLKNINHPFIVNLKYAFQTKSHLYMVIDYLNGGELFYHLTHDDYFPEPRAKLYAAEVVSALGYLHEHHILYRDLKPENLILDMHGHICLVDFGLCKVGWHPNTKTHTYCGSAEYLAPEILKGKGYGKEVDWWALGTLIYEMLSGLPPFWDEDEDYMQKKILSATLKMHKYFSPEVKDLIKQLLERDPEKRIGTGIDGTAKIKSHPWFSSIDWAALERREEVPPFVPHIQSEQDSPYVEEAVLSELPALSLTNQSLNLDPDLFAGFSYDSEAVTLSKLAGNAKTAKSRENAATPVRRKRADSATELSDSGEDNPRISLGNTPDSGKLGVKTGVNGSRKADNEMIFSLEDSNDDA